jgi:hypothetical protein
LKKVWLELEVRIVFPSFQFHRADVL